jgi:hypothetical protein
VVEGATVVTGAGAVVAPGVTDVGTVEAVEAVEPVEVGELAWPDESSPEEQLAAAMARATSNDDRRAVTGGEGVRGVVS